MSTFIEPFRCYLVPGDQVTKQAMITGTIVLDTNVLLSAYRFAPAAREELLSAISLVADRLWIPHRVADEFHRNRLSVISDYDEAYIPVIDGLRLVQQNLDDELKPKVKELANRASLTEQDKTELLDLVSKSTDAARSAVERLRAEHGLADLRGEDDILSRFATVLDGKIGHPFSESDRIQATDEAARRAENRIPPGYLDAKKPEPFGDYFVWRQLLVEASNRKGCGSSRDTCFWGEPGVVPDSGVSLRTWT